MFPRSGFVVLAFCFVCNVFLNTKSSASFFTKRIRSTRYGNISGKILDYGNDRAECYLGVPYALPPLGQLRLQYPRPPKSWNNSPLECINFKPVCPQVLHEEKEQSEDCLYLNIFVPYTTNKTSITRYPVLIWIHGGSYFTGDGNKFPLKSTVQNLVASGIIVVYVNYRLGPLGYLSLANNSLPGNYGIEDQLQAVKWVHDNIQFFNGDPNEITITGESAGGASVSLLAISNKTRGLVKRVMPQSGCSLSTWAVSTERTKENTEKILKEINCTVTGNHSLFMECLRRIPHENFTGLLQKLEAQSIIFTPEKNDAQRALSHMALPYFTPVVDPFRGTDSILDDSPENLLKRNSNLTMFIGCTNLEELDLVYYSCRQWSEIINARQAKVPIFYQWRQAGWYTFFKVQLCNLSLNSQNQVVSFNLNVLNYKFPFTADDENEIDWEAIIPASTFNNPKLAYQSMEKYYNVRTDANTTDLVRMLAKIGSDNSFIAPAVREATYYAQNNNTVYFYYYVERNNSDAINDFNNGEEEGDLELPDGCGTSEDFQSKKKFCFFSYDASHGLDMARLFQDGKLAFRYSPTEWETGNPPLTRFLSKMITNFVKSGNPNLDNSLQTDWKKFTTKNKRALLIDAQRPKMVDMVEKSNFNFWYNILPAVEKLQCT